MQLFYIGESGTSLKDKQSPFFVLAAIAIPDGRWQELDSQLAALKRGLVSWAKPEDFELKGRNLQRGEGVFQKMNWETRLKAMIQVAELVAQFRCPVLAVQIDKRDLPTQIASQSDLYRIAFWRLLDEIDGLLQVQTEAGMLMVDSRSDLHSSVQDRRLLDAYRDWLASRAGRTNLVELPWFGFSAFYAGLQLADFAAYLVDQVYNEESRGKRSDALREPFSRFEAQVRLLKIP